jgi:glycerophosphoryl diester phosphodiesterase
VRKPAVIAHRGASGYLPEHTAEAKAMAHAFGADYLEQDVVATRDGVLLVLHDLYLEYITNVAECFPDRARDDGHFYVVDFDYSEVATLDVHERRREDSDQALFPHRFPRDLGRFRVARLRDELELIAGLNHSTGRAAGIYPEIKHPRWYAAHDIDLAARLLAELAEHGYTARDDDVFVQCFDARELRRVREGLATELKLVQLLTRDDDLSAAALRHIATYADGIGVPLSRLIEGKGAAMRPTSVCRAAHEAGLLVHPYTFRKDQLPPGVPDLEALLRLFYVEISVDGVFCDHPDIAVAVRSNLGLD